MVNATLSRRIGNVLFLNISGEKDQGSRVFLDRNGMIIPAFNRPKRQPSLITRVVYRVMGFFGVFR